jgi:hypothetical protein
MVNNIPKPVLDIVHDGEHRGGHCSTAYRVRRFRHHPAQHCRLSSFAVSVSSACNALSIMTG